LQLIGNPEIINYQLNSKMLFVLCFTTFLVVFEFNW
jgi:hypothetical protein